jgi:SAM-dependent methyltransferase
VASPTDLKGSSSDLLIFGHMTSQSSGAVGLDFPTAAPMSSAPYLREPVLQFAGNLGPGMRVLDAGCGNGDWAGLFADRGCTVVGVDPSASGIEIARGTHARVRFERTEVTEDILDRLNEDPFDLVVSTEVVEHLYDPSSFARSCYAALVPGGRLIVSTPYHGRIKDIALAVSGKLDRHHDALRVGGHIKFFSQPTLEALLLDAGFCDPQFLGAGRLPRLWKSMVIAADRPG